MGLILPSLGRIIIYTKHMAEMVEFYCGYFGYASRQIEGDRIVELCPQGKGLTILLHPASKAQKEGQALIKLVFDVEDVAGFIRSAEGKGLKFGSVHRADGYVFANAKDPSNNSISVSSRAFALLKTDRAGE